MQWVPAYVGIDENKTADALPKEARKLNNDKLPNLSEYPHQTQDMPPERDENPERWCKNIPAMQELP
ncbi:hypothetical protein TNCV_2867451 [Trichonephila clavipes]|nr:hypothetical protein TNCV_2867451 [Trichonephila clavipes]